MYMIGEQKDTTESIYEYGGALFRGGKPEPSLSQRFHNEVEDEREDEREDELTIEILTKLNEE